jgi:N-acetylmuramoyl-L-alanine amidase
MKVLITILTAFVASSAGAFDDTAGDVYAAEILSAYQNGLVAGFEDGLFHPLEPVTREQMAAMIGRLLEQTPGVYLPLPSEVVSDPFSDVSARRWSASVIQAMKDQGLILGYADGRFLPERMITRAELVTMIKKASEFALFQLRGSDVIPARGLFEFADVRSHWAGQNIQTMSGFCRVATPENEMGTHFVPDGVGLRNYAAAAVYRAFHCLARLGSPRR